MNWRCRTKPCDRRRPRWRNRATGYVSLYDCALIGCLTLSLDGLIAGTNLTGAKLLGAERTRLLQTRFASRVIPADRQRWAKTFLNIAQRGGKGRLERALQRQDSTIFQAQLDYEQQKVGAGETAIASYAAVCARKTTASPNPAGGTIFHFTLPVASVVQP